MGGYRRQVHTLDVKKCQLMGNASLIGECQSLGHAKAVVIA